MLDFRAHLFLFLFSFLCWKFLYSIVCYRKCCHLRGEIDPQPSLGQPMLIMKNDVLAVISL